MTRDHDVRREKQGQRPSRSMRWSRRSHARPVGDEDPARTTGVTMPTSAASASRRQSPSRDARVCRGGVISVEARPVEASPMAATAASANSAGPSPLISARTGYGERHEEAPATTIARMPVLIAIGTTTGLTMKRPARISAIVASTHGTDAGLQEIDGKNTPPNARREGRHEEIDRLERKRPAPRLWRRRNQLALQPHPRKRRESGATSARPPPQRGEGPLPRTPLLSGPCL